MTPPLHNYRPIRQCFCDWLQKGGVEQSENQEVSYQEDPSGGSAWVDASQVLVLPPVCSFFQKADFFE